jgi:hypothetical protein
LREEGALGAALLALPQIRPEAQIHALERPEKRCRRPVQSLGGNRQQQCKALFERDCPRTELAERHNQSLLPPVFDCSRRRGRC